MVGLFFRLGLRFEQLIGILESIKLIIFGYKIIIRIFSMIMIEITILILVIIKIGIIIIDNIRLILNRILKLIS